MRRDRYFRRHLLLPGLVGLMLVLALGLLAVGAHAQEGPDALVRILNASPDAPLDVYIQDTRVVGDLAFMQASGYGWISAGFYSVKVLPAGADPAGEPLLEGNATLLAGLMYSLVLYDEGDRLKVRLVVDDNGVIPSGARLRFFQAAPDLGAASLVTGDGQVLFREVPFGREGEALSLASGDYDLQVQPGRGGPPALRETVRLEEGAIVLALAAGFAAGEPPLRLWLLPYPPQSGAYDRDDWPALLAGEAQGTPVPSPTAGADGVTATAPATETAAATATTSDTPTTPPTETALPPSATATPVPTETATVAPTEAPPDATPSGTALPATTAAVEPSATTSPPTATPTAGDTPTTPAPTETALPSPTETAAPGETATPGPGTTPSPQGGLPTTGAEDGPRRGISALVLILLGLVLLNTAARVTLGKSWWR